MLCSPGILARSKYDSAKTVRLCSPLGVRVPVSALRGIIMICTWLDR